MDKELEIILSKCALSTRMTALTFFPERFYMPFAEEVHGKILNRSLMMSIVRSSMNGFTPT